MRLLRSRWSLAMTVICIFFTSCQTIQPKQAVSSRESTQEVTSAVGSVAGALAGQEMTGEETRKVVESLRKDKEGRSALRLIAGAMDVKKTGVQYCPVDGRRFSADLDECPEHKVKLKDLVE